MNGNTIPGRVRLWRGMMELSAKPENPCRAISSGFMKKWNPDENLTEECRHLLRILEKKIDVLCDDENGDTGEGYPYKIPGAHVVSHERSAE